MASYYEEGISLPKTPRPGEEPKPWPRKTRVVGTHMPRVDSHERVSGEAVYYDDLVLPRMLYGAILRCPHANAKIKRIDTSAAERMPGVHAVIHGGSPELKQYTPIGTWADPTAKRELFPSQCRHHGEYVAAVAAECPYLARDAVRAIKVDYEVLPFVVDELEALKPGAPLVRGKSNKRVTDKYERGDINKGFGEADVVLEEDYKAECIFHHCPEPVGCVADWDGDSLTLWVGTQGVYAPVQGEITAGLGLPRSKCRIISKYTGGGYGGRTHTFFAHFAAALLAKKTGRPVKIATTREENYGDGGNAPPHNMKIKAGVKRDGTLTAYHYATINTGGSLSSGGIFWYDRPFRDLYLCPNVLTEGTDVYINGPHSWPLRAPCHFQATFGMEVMMDTLAEQIGMDPVEMRLKNIPTFAQDMEGNPPYTTTGLKECIADGAKAFGWKAARRRAERTREGDVRRGVGMAAGSFEMGFIWPPTTPVLKLSADGSVKLNIGEADMGTGTKTALSMVVAEELGVKPEFIDVELGDTGTTQFSQVSAGSRTIPTSTPAVREAAIKVKQQLIDMAAGDLKVDPSDLVVEGGQIVSTKDRGKKLKITDVSTLKDRQVIIGVAHHGANPPGKRVKPFCAHFCEVEVNMKTMEVKVLRYLAAQDAGRVIFRSGLEGQIAGGSTQGIGHALTEARVFDRQTGKLLTTNMHDYKVPTIKDVATDFSYLLVDKGDTFSSTGAKGGGEPPRVPGMGAIANAVYHATGIRFKRTFINPTRLRA